MHAKTQTAARPECQCESPRWRSQLVKPPHAASQAGLTKEIDAWIPRRLYAGGTIVVRPSKVHPWPAAARQPSDTKGDILSLSGHRFATHSGSLPHLS
eukprot:scaffold30_cov416-Prasinococcus_capsulatus_cf.AAC.2